MAEWQWSPVAALGRGVKFLPGALGQHVLLWGAVGAADAPARTLDVPVLY